MHQLFRLAALAGLSVLTACQSVNTTSGGAVGVERKQYMFSMLSAEEVDKLADLESREVLLSKVAGMMKASMSKAAAVFQALPSKLVRTVDALRAKQDEQGGAE